MNEVNAKNIALESNRYEANKTWVRVFKISEQDGKRVRQGWFNGLVTQVTDRGLIVNPFDPKPAGESTDVLAGSFVPYALFNPAIEIQIVKERE